MLCTHLLCRRAAQWSTAEAWQQLNEALGLPEEHLVVLRQQCAPRPPGPSSTYLCFPYTSPLGGPLTLAAGLEDGTEELAVLVNHSLAPICAWAVGDKVQYRRRNKDAVQERVLLGITHNAAAKTYTAWLWSEAKSDYEKLPVAQLRTHVGRLAVDEMAKIYKRLSAQQHAPAVAPAAARVPSKAKPPTRNRKRSTGYVRLPLCLHFPLRRPHTLSQADSGPCEAAGAAKAQAQAKG